MSFVSSPVHTLGRLLDSVDLAACRPRWAEPTTPSSPQPFSGRLFDVDPETGFFPTQPYRNLKGQFQLWEEELVIARGVLKLGEDRGDDAMSKCAKGEQWRERLRSVSIH